MENNPHAELLSLMKEEYPEYAPIALVRTETRWMDCGGPVTNTDAHARIELAAWKAIRKRIASLGWGQIVVCDTCPDEVVIFRLEDRIGLVLVGRGPDDPTALLSALRAARKGAER